MPIRPRHVTTPSPTCRCDDCEDNRRWNEAIVQGDQRNRAVLFNVNMREIIEEMFSVEIRGRESLTMIEWIEAVKDAIKRPTISPQKVKRRIEWL